MVPHPRKVLTVDGNQSVEEALELLARHRVQSVPVWDDEKGGWIGFVDVLDILTFALCMYTEGVACPQPQAWHDYTRDRETLSHRGVRFGIKPIKHIVDASRMDAFSRVYETGTVYQLIEDVFARGVHRAAVMGDKQTITNLISQSDVLLFILANIHKLGADKERTVRQLNLGNQSSVIAMSTNAQAIHAYYLMFFHKVSAVAITLPQGQLVGNLSASDIRGLNAASFPSLLQPVTEYLSGREGVKPPATCTLDTSLEAVLLKLSLHRVHRLWIVNDRDEPIGVISFTDVMTTLATLPSMDMGGKGTKRTEMSSE